MQVKNYLEKKSKSQKELAEHLGVTPCHVSLLLSGKRQWSLELAIKTSVFLDEKIDTLFL